MFKKIILKIKYFTSVVDLLYRSLCALNKQQDDKFRKLRNLNNLNEKSFSIYSQSDEDGIIDQIFNKITIKSKFFIELGVENGLESNTTFLLSQNWKGIWFEGNLKFKDPIYKIFEQSITTNQLKVIFGYLDENIINKTLSDNCNNINPDLLSIDIGLSTFRVLKSIDVIKPRVIIVEYNPIFGPSKNIVVQENNSKNNNWWSGEFMFGASLKAYELLLKDYKLVACSSSGANAFFVHIDEDLTGFDGPFTSENLYESEKYYLIKSFKSFHTKKLFKKTFKVE